MRTKSLHLKGIKNFLQVRGAHPPQTPPFKRTIEKIQHCLKGTGTRKWASMRTKFYQNWTLKISSSLK